MSNPIYLDYNATTPILPKVADAMLPYLFEHHGNPSSSHHYGVRTKTAVELARTQVAKLLNCLPEEIVFTSGGTESNNHAIRGAAVIKRSRGKHIISSGIEHPAVIQVCRWLASQGFDITLLPVDQFGMVNTPDLEAAITPETILVSIMLANNEVGTLQPVKELAEIAHAHGALFHTDAAQAVGKIPVDVRELGIDLLSVAGHKLYASKGVGALYIRKGITIPNLMFGAGHELGRRPGTENVISIVGLGKACEIAGHDLNPIQKHFRDLRDTLQETIVNNLGSDRVRLNGHPDIRLPNTLNISFLRIAANELLTKIEGQVAASAGSACHADRMDISTVLQAMKLPIDWAMGTVRFSVGRGTTESQINQAAQIIIAAVNDLYVDPQWVE